MSEHAALIHVTTLVAAAGRVDDLINAARPIAQRANESDGCFGAQLCEVAGQSGTIAMISRWQRREALDQFLTANGANVANVLAGLLDQPPASVNYLPLQP